MVFWILLGVSLNLFCFGISQSLDNTPSVYFQFFWDKWVILLASLAFLAEKTLRPIWYTSTALVLATTTSLAGIFCFSNYAALLGLACFVIALLPFGQKIYPTDPTVRLTANVFLVVMVVISGAIAFFKGGPEYVVVASQGVEIQYYPSPCFGVGHSDQCEVVGFQFSLHGLNSYHGLNDQFPPPKN